MNRIIKFKRIYFKEKKVIEVAYWGVNIDDSSFTSPKNVASADSYIDCQYTGRNDKNGKEIYEGDVDEYNYKGETKKAVVFWDNMKAGFYISSVRMYDYYKTGSNKYLRAEHLNSKNKTVIGNIYENPELLK